MSIEDKIAALPKIGRDCSYFIHEMDRWMVPEDEYDALSARNALLCEALRNLEIAANTAGYCRDRRPENFAAAMRDLSAYADNARAVLGACTAGNSTGQPSASICPECGCAFGAHRDYCSAADNSDEVKP